MSSSAGKYSHSDQRFVAVGQRQSVPYSGTPLTNDLVPSIGSMIQQYLALLFRWPYSSPMMP